MTGMPPSPPARPQPTAAERLNLLFYRSCSVNHSEQRASHRQSQPSSSPLSRVPYATAPSRHEPRLYRHGRHPPTPSPGLLRGRVGRRSPVRRNNKTHEPGLLSATTTKHGNAQSFQDRDAALDPPRYQWLVRGSPADLLPPATVRAVRAGTR